MEAKIRLKVACDKAAYDAQWRLLDGAVPEAVLHASVDVLQPPHYRDVVTERAIGGLCGYPCCGASLGGRSAGPRHRISLAEKRVYNVERLDEFCSRECARRSNAFAATVPATALFLRKGSEAAGAIAAVERIAATAAAGTAAGTAAAARAAEEAEGVAPAPLPVPATSSVRPSPHGGGGQLTSVAVGGDESPPILGRIVERPSRPPRPCPAIPTTTSGSSGGLVEGHAPRDVTVPAARAPRFVQRGESLRFEFPART